MDDLFDDLDDGKGGGEVGQNQQPFSEAQVNALGTMFERALDRRINAVLKDRRQAKPKPPVTQNDGNQGGQEQAVTVDRGAQREARLAFREYVGDRVKFVSEVERQHAMALGANQVAGWDGDGDPDQFGAQVAENVGASVLALRKHYRDLTVSQLRRRGQLKEEPKSNGQLGTEGGFQLPAPTGGAPGAGSAHAQTLPPVTRAAAAVQNAVNLAAEFNQANGRQPANQQ
jgi:hypothetical protein